MWLQTLISLLWGSTCSDAHIMSYQRQTSWHTRVWQIYDWALTPQLNKQPPRDKCIPCSPTSPQTRQTRCTHCPFCLIASLQLSTHPHSGWHSAGTCIVQPRIMLPYLCNTNVPFIQTENTPCNVSRFPGMFIQHDPAAPLTRGKPQYASNCCKHIDCLIRSSTLVSR